MMSKLSSMLLFSGTQEFISGGEGLICQIQVKRNIR